MKTCARKLVILHNAVSINRGIRIGPRPTCRLTSRRRLVALLIYALAAVIVFGAGVAQTNAASAPGEKEYLEAAGLFTSALQLADNQERQAAIERAFAAVQQVREATEGTFLSVRATVLLGDIRLEQSRLSDSIALYRTAATHFKDDTKSLNNEEAEYYSYLNSKLAAC